MAPPSDPPQEAPTTNDAPHPNSGILNQPTTPQWTPQTVLSTLPASERPTTTPTPTTPIPFFHLLTRLKTTKREGWRRFGINHGESISDHMYRMSLMTMLAPASLTSRLDIPRCTKMALVHDMAELLVGDITPIDGVLKAEKNRREASTMDYLSKTVLGCVGGGLQGEEVRALWQEYEESESEESKFVHDVDKVELVLQMLEYERANGGEVDLGEFVWVAKRIVLPECRAWCQEILEERDVFWKGVGKEPSGGRLSKEREVLQKEYYGDGGEADAGSEEKRHNGHA